MNKKNKLITVFITLLLACAGSNAIAQQKFQKVIAKNSGVSGESILQTTDKGYLGLSSNDFYLGKTDSTGKLIHVKQYPVSSSTVNSFVVIPTSDGGYLLTGYALVKIAKDESVQWAKVYKSGATYLELTGARQTPDGGYIMSSVNDSGICLIKINSTGSIRWTRNYTPGGSKEVPYSIILTADGGYAVAGASILYGAGKVNGFILKTDSLGKEQWSNSYGHGHGGIDLFASIASTTDGGYIIAGVSERIKGVQNYHLLIKIDSKGTQQWIKGMALAYYADMPSKAIQTADGGYLLGGGTDFGDKRDTSKTSYLYKTDTSGKMQWAKQYAAGGIRNFQPTADGGYILAGNLTFSKNSIYIGKTDANGYNGCVLPAFSPTLVSDTLTESAISFVSKTINTTESTLSVTPVTIPVGDTTICTSAGTIPAAPSNLSLTPLKTADKKIRLNWTDNSNNEDGFYVERSPDGSTKWTQISSLVANVTTFTDTGLTPATKYYYRVLAYNSAGNSSYSNTISTTTITSIAESDLLSGINIFPNPSISGKFIINFNEMSNNMKVSVIDMLGKKVYSEQIIHDNSSLDLSSFHKGMYIILMNTGNEIYSQKLIIE